MRLPAVHNHLNVGKAFQDAALKSLGQVLSICTVYPMARRPHGGTQHTTQRWVECRSNLFDAWKAATKIFKIRVACYPRENNHSG